MTYASLDLSKELWELSGWETEYCYATNDVKTEILRSDNPFLGHDYYRLAYAYDLGYILRKLSAIDDPDNGEPKNISVELSVLDNYAVATAVRGITRVDFDQPIQRILPSCDAAAPEDTAVKLAIELWKQGILK